MFQKYILSTYSDFKFNHKNIGSYIKSRMNYVYKYRDYQETK